MKSNFYNDAIIIEKVTHTYKTDTGLLPVIKNLNMTVPKNGFTAVVGPSGCGKSTLTKLISGLLKPDNGEVYLNGEKVLGPKSIVGMAFQNPVLLEWRSILKMSNYKKDDWCDVVDGLYWMFMSENISFFKSNPRLAILVKSLERMNIDRKELIFAKAIDFINTRTTK